jgi:hypothetical protein
MVEAPNYGASELHTTPRWVKVFGIVAVIVVVLFVVMLFSPGHGPGRHMHRAVKPAAESRAQHTP